MKKVIIYYDPEGRCRQIICPFKQTGKREEMFDGAWKKLVDHVTKSTNERKNYWKFEIV